MSEEYRVTIAPELYAKQIELLKIQIELRDQQIDELKVQLRYEQELRISAEAKLAEAPKRRVCKAVGAKTPVEYSEFKSDGKRKAHAADSIRSYDDFYAIQKYYLDKGQVRNWAMWTIGVSLGLRVSDLLSLKFKHLMNTDKRTYRPRLQVYEQKTGKYNSCLITEAVKNAMEVYLCSIKREFDLEGYVFPSRKTKEKMFEEHGWKILSDAGKALNLPLVIGSHTMRKSFANIAACVDKSSVDMNAITKIQGLLNHSDQRVTMKYLGAYQDMYDRARIAVSDFVLGKTDVNEIIAGSQYSTDDVMDKLEALENMLTQEKEVET